MSASCDHSQIVPVPGFGFIPACIRHNIETQYQELLRGLNLSTASLEPPEADKIKCEWIIKPNWRDFFPDIASRSIDQNVCGPMWDNASCIPPALADTTAVFPCMRMYEGRWYPECVNASRRCTAEGAWEMKTDYNDCMMGAREQIECSPVDTNDISLSIYLVGYIVSFLALTSSMVVFLSFRELQYLRHKIHLGLFLSFGLSAFSWIITIIITELAPEIETDMFTVVTCVLHLLTVFFHITTFYWMFIEGFYLFLQVQFPLSLASIKFKHFQIFGWGAPIANAMLLIMVKLLKHFTSDLTSSSCPFFIYSELDIVMEIPILTLLTSNFLFLIWVIIIVVSKLNQQTIRLDHEKRHFKAAKALICVCPLLGISYLLTLMVPNIQGNFRNVFVAVRDFILSFQGLVISIIYGFANEDVQNVLRTHWKRRMLVRMVKREGRERTVSLKVSVRDMGDMGDAGDHSNITQLTVT